MDGFTRLYPPPPILVRKTIGLIIHQPGLNIPQPVTAAKTLALKPAGMKMFSLYWFG